MEEGLTAESHVSLKYMCHEAKNYKLKNTFFRERTFNLKEELHRNT